MVRRVDLSDDVGRIAGALAGISARRYATTPPGVQDLGAAGDTVWTDRTSGEPRSVREEAERVAGLVDQALELAAGLETLDETLTEAQEVLDQARTDLDALGMGDAGVDQVVAQRIAAAVATLLTITTEQITVTGSAMISKVFAEAIAASLGYYNLLVISAAQLDPGVGAALDLSGNPGLDGLASDADLSALQQQVDTVDGQVQQVRNAVVIEPTGITITDGQSAANQVRISNSRLSFDADGFEVAWIDGGQRRMVIRDLEALQSAIVGRHAIESFNSDITVVRWVG